MVNLRFGPTRTFSNVRCLSALPPKADMVRYDCDVRFVRLGDIFLALTSIVVPSPNIATQPRAGSGMAAVIRPARGFGTLRIKIAATTHSAPAAKNAGK